MRYRKRRTTKKRSGKSRRKTVSKKRATGRSVSRFRSRLVGDRM